MDAAADPPAAALGVRLIAARDQLEAVVDDWDALAVRVPSPIQSYTWAIACAEAFDRHYALWTLVAGRPAEPLAIAPLARRRGPLGRLEFLGIDAIWEPIDFLGADERALDALTNAVVDSGLPLFLRRLPADSPVLPAVRRAYKGRGVVLSRETVGSPYIELHDGWKEPERQLSSGRRSDVRRALRRAEAIGPVRSEVLSPTPDELEPLLEEAFRVERSNWKGRTGTALACDPLLGTFYRRLAHAAAQRGIFRLSFLHIGERRAAMQLAVEYANRFWLLKIGYDEAFAACSPGILLLRGTVREAAARGLTSFEFLGGVEPWTRAWTPLEHPCVSVWAYPFRPRGALRLASDLAMISWRKAARSLRRAP